MKRKQIKILIIVFITILVLINLPFLPGPNFINAPAQIFYTCGLLIGMTGIIGVPFGLIWIIVSKSKKQNLFKPLLFTMIFLTPLLSLFTLTNFCRDLSRNIAINNGNKLVQRIEDYKNKNGNYPENIENSVIKIPNSWIIGVEGYNYQKTEKNFEVTFTQNLLFGFNFEIVTYNSNKEQKAKGELKTLYPTSDKNWKYEIFD
jgi:hypothetical protein